MRDEWSSAIRPAASDTISSSTTTSYVGISGRKERGHWPRFQEADRNRRLLATAIAAFDSLESDAKDENIRQTLVWLLSENAT